jgi:hypothetical protein
VGVGVVGSWRGFRVVLDGKDRKCFVPNAFHRSVVEIDVGDLQIARPGDGSLLALNRESVVLRRYKYLSCTEIAYWMVTTPMAIGQFDRLSSEGEAQELVAQANAKSGKP